MTETARIHVAARGWRGLWRAGPAAALDIGAKDTVGTAYAASSRAWYTVSHGILNEIYYPTIDRPQIRDMEFLITDGETFFHEEKRDLEHEFAYIDSDALGVRITSRDRDGPLHDHQGDHQRPALSGGADACAARRRQGFVVAAEGVCAAVSAH